MERRTMGNSAGLPVFRPPAAVVQLFADHLAVFDGVDFSRSFDLLIYRSTFSTYGKTVAYNKWIREQVQEWLRLPELYADLHSVLEVHRLQSGEVDSNSDDLPR
jgi:hypothetical protein